MIKLAVVFRHPPHGTAAGREGLDALLAATAFCHEDELAVFFLDDGVFHLLADQQPESILQKDFIRGFKLLALYDIERRYVCRQSLRQFNLQQQPRIISCAETDRTLLLNMLRQAQKVLTF